MVSNIKSFLVGLLENNCVLPVRIYERLRGIWIFSRTEIIIICVDRFRVEYTKNVRPWTLKKPTYEEKQAFSPFYLLKADNF